MKTAHFATVAAACLLGLGAIALAQPPAPGGGGGGGAPSGGGAGPGGGAGAPSGNQTFQWTACNKSNYNAWIAISNRVKFGGDVWRNHGWYAVPRGECKFMGTFSKGVFYWYAIDDQNGHWGGNGKEPDESTCVSLTSAFDFSYNNSAGACPAGMTPVWFLKLPNVTTDTLTSNLNN